jgi:hypothetical protein
MAGCERRHESAFGRPLMLRVGVCDGGVITALNHRRKCRMLVKTSIFWLVSVMDTPLLLLLNEVRDRVRPFLVDFTAGHGIAIFRAFCPTKRLSPKQEWNNGNRTQAQKYGHRAAGL